LPEENVLMTCLNYNGTIISSEKEIIRADNRGFRYGDGLFETMKMINGVIPLAELHFQRLMDGARLLEFEIPPFLTAEFLAKQILDLAGINNHQDKARVRLMIFRGEGGLYDAANTTNYLIQTWSLADVTELNETGLVIDLYPDARIACDRFSNLKSNNYLPYLMGAMFVKRHQLDDCVLLNAGGNICDATIANVFLIKGGMVSTPALTEGCVAGVMRRFLINSLAGTPYQVMEKSIAEPDLLEAEEVFLTNAVFGIRWVSRFRNSTFHNRETAIIYESVIKNIF
jgi:branched-chain amino acid aminotransferase